MSEVETGQGEVSHTNEWQTRLKERIKPAELPIGKRREEILTLIDKTLGEKNVALIQGETGSGKSILLPGMLREKLLERELSPKTLVIQPRRDAAMNVSRGISAVEGLSWGERGIVGCSTSEAKEVNKDSEILVVTTGIALRYLSEILQKTRNEDYSPDFGAVIVDEFHENSVEYHLILGMLQMLREKEKAPFVLLTSATLDKKKTQNFFDINDEEYLKVEGRAYPVSVKYSNDKEPRDPEKQDYIREAVHQTLTLLKEKSVGDILVFMPGVREINATIRQLGTISNVEILALHGSLSLEEREYAITSQPKPGLRRVIVSTNIAETSLTLPRIVAVVDSCRRRSVKYNPATGIYERETDLISHDSAAQRTGRAGRVQPGTCHRLVTKDEWEEMPENIIPEIYHANLSHVVLKLRGLDINPEEFPFIDPPEKETLRQAEKQLTILGALEENGKLTSIGRRMLDMPFFEPSVARMVVEAEKRDCLMPALIMAVLERESNIFYSPSQREILNTQLDLLEEREYFIESEKPLRIFRGDTELYDDEIKPLLDSVLDSARRQLRNEYEEKHNQFGKGSDWKRNLNVFLAAIKEGVLEATRNERTPEGYRIREQFTERCREYHLNEKALLHAASHVFDYARMLDIDLDVDILPEVLEFADWEKLSMVILAGHPHMLLYKVWGTGSMPEYQFFQDESRREINISPGSSAFQRAPMCCIATKIHEGQGTAFQRKITRNYASGIHPIEPFQIMELFPHLLERKEKEIYLDTLSGEVKISIALTPKGSEEVLEEFQEIASPERREEFLANRNQQEAAPWGESDIKPPFAFGNGFRRPEIPTRSPEELQMINEIRKTFKATRPRFDQLIFKMEKMIAKRDSEKNRKENIPVDEHQYKSLRNLGISIERVLYNTSLPIESLQDDMNELLTQLASYEEKIATFEAEKEPENSAMAAALQKVMGVYETTEEGPEAGLGSMERKVREKTAKEAVRESNVQSTLSLEILNRINSVSDQEQKVFQIMEEQEEIKLRIISLEGEVETHEALSSQTEGLNVKAKGLRGKLQDTEREIKGLTQKKEDRQRESGLRAERRAFAEQLRAVDEELALAKIAKNKSIELSRERALLEAQAAELIALEKIHSEGL